jgi:muramoyltetrapeptide carboxypeptidase
MSARRAAPVSAPPESAPPPPTLTVFAASGVLVDRPAARRAVQRLRTLGFDARLDADALARHQRFAGDDAVRLAALHRVADEAPSVALALRGGYGLTRLLDGIDWRRIARSIERGTRWVGQSDVTALQLAALAHGVLAAPARGKADRHGHAHDGHGHPAPGGLWQGPLAHDDFSRDAAAGGPDDVTEACFLEAMHGELEAVGFRTEAGHDGLEARGTLWGGNLCVLLSLLGTPHWPQVKGGILFLEDINEHPYRIERCLLQLHQAGVLDTQRAIVLGHFNGYKPSPLDRGYTLKSALAHVRAVTRTPILTGLPFGHVPTKVCLPVGRRTDLVVQGRDVLLAWGH